MMPLSLRLSYGSRMNPDIMSDRCSLHAAWSSLAKCNATLTTYRKALVKLTFGEFFDFLRLYFSHSQLQHCVFLYTSASEMGE